ncbi:hypothetical protein GCM10022200_02960 [Microbacterium awajiense]|uniref:Uncharacterized protein n=1 Tax=Microbacterium awajiense TaxID=415214 RepID=A0ABP7A3C1_9MICO
MSTVAIPSRFRGPPHSANGGWTAGTLAAVFDGPVQVTLRAPTPLDVDLRLDRTDSGVALRHDGTLLAEAVAGRLEGRPPLPVSWDDAVEASTRYVGFHDHPYPTCFVCGTDRGTDALRIFPGAVDGREVVAAPWTAPADLCTAGRARIELVWAALDCPSWFGHLAFHGGSTRILLGRLTAHVEARPAADERCVVLGWPRGKDGRKIRSGSALYSEDGRLLASAEALWIELREPDATG